MKPLIRWLLGLAVLTTARLTLAQPAALYHQAWPWPGSDLKSLSSFGWFHLLPAAGFVGNYEEPSANDADANESLPSSVIYFGAEKAGTGFFYTTNGTAVKSGGPTFIAIEPAACSNLTFTVETQHSWQGTNLICRFAVQSGGGGYAAAGHELESFVQDAASGSFQKTSLVFNPQAKNWTRLDPATATLGAPAAADLAGRITGVGIFVKLTGGGSWDFNRFTVTAARLK